MDEVERIRESWRLKAREIGKEVVAPRAREIDATGEFAWDIVDTFGKSGFLSLLIPKEYGGEDSDIISLCHVVE